MQAIETLPDLDRLFREAAEDLARYFSRRHDDTQSPQDLVQETFSEMAKSLERGRAPRSPRAYLFGIARKVSQAAWKRQYRERSFTTSTESADREWAAPEADGRISAAHEMIATLPSLHREALDLRFTQGLSYAEIAEALNIPVGTVRSRLHHAIRAVRNALAEDDPDNSPNDTNP